MFNVNGMLKRLKMLKSLELWKSAIYDAERFLVAMRLKNKLIVLGLLLLFLLLLSACATPFGASKLPMNPPKPQLSEPLPSESYLETVQKDIQRWLDVLKAM